MNLYFASKGLWNRDTASTLIHHQEIICGVAFPPEAGKRSLLLAAYCSIRLTRRSSAPSI